MKAILIKHLPEQGVELNKYFNIYFPLFTIFELIKLEGLPYARANYAVLIPNKNDYPHLENTMWEGPDRNGFPILDNELSCFVINESDMC